MPILAMTAADDAVAVARCRAAGMDGLLGKPVSRDKLIALLRHHGDQS